MHDHRLILCAVGQEKAVGHLCVYIKHVITPDRVGAVVQSEMRG